MQIASAATFEKYDIYLPNHIPSPEVLKRTNSGNIIRAVPRRHSSPGLWTFRLFKTGWLLTTCAISLTAQSKPMALEQSRYQVRAGEPVPLAASSETVDFLLKATTRQVVA